jgi:hypothetical protein
VAGGGRLLGVAKQAGGASERTIKPPRRRIFLAETNPFMGKSASMPGRSPLSPAARGGLAAGMADPRRFRSGLLLKSLRRLPGNFGDEAGKAVAEFSIPAALYLPTLAPT